MSSTSKFLFDRLESDIKEMMDELHYLRWWVHVANFGPADGDVREHMNNIYTKYTGRPVPKGWGNE